MVLIYQVLTRQCLKKVFLTSNDFVPNDSSLLNIVSPEWSVFSLALFFSNKVLWLIFISKTIWPSSWIIWTLDFFLLLAVILINVAAKIDISRIKSLDLHISPVCCGEDVLLHKQQNEHEYWRTKCLWDSQPSCRYKGSLANALSPNLLEQPCSLLVIYNCEICFHSESSVLWDRLELNHSLTVCYGIKWRKDVKPRVTSGYKKIKCRLTWWACQTEQVMELIRTW